MKIMLNVNIEKLKMAQKEIINAGIKGEKAIEKLKSIESSMNKLTQKKDSNKDKKLSDI